MESVPLKDARAEQAYFLPRRPPLSSQALSDNQLSSPESTHRGQPAPAYAHTGNPVLPSQMRMVIIRDQMADS